MDKFLKFLQIAKTALSNLHLYRRIHLVLGNESCDLDSTVSALALAYLIYVENIEKEPDYLVIPIMNVDAKYFPLRTETCYLLKECGIELNNLIFKDQINYSEILKHKNVETTLVDHHVLSQHDKVLEKTVIQIFDHRPINSDEIVQNDALKKTIKLVGSCSTLITNEIINSKLTVLFKELSYLLYATIVYDTIGLDKNCGKTFDEDLEMASKLEDILEPTQKRKELFDILFKVHSDTSNLTTKELLYRDLKVVQGIPIPGLPMLVINYLKREDSDLAISSFAQEFNSHSIVLIGIDASEEVKRDIAVYSTDMNFKNALISILKNSNEIAGSDLLLNEIPVRNKDIVCFQQGNIKLTRKFILPLVNEAAKKYFNDNCICK